MNTAKRILAVAVILVCTLGMKQYFSKPAPMPARHSLADFPAKLGAFEMVSQTKVQDDIQAVLKADDSLLRTYRNPQGESAELFIAYYAVQRAGESMHSPKNCLPGSGWAPVVNDVVTLTNPDGSDPVEVNRYIIEKDGSRALVLYWYQTHGRVIASEYWGKFYLVSDALRTGRRDGAIVRVVVPLSRFVAAKIATEEGLRFASAMRPELPKFLPE